MERSTRRHPGQVRKRRWSLVLKILVTAAILAFLIHRIDLAQSWDAVRRAQPGWLVLAFAICSTAFITSSLKWHGLLLAMGIASRRWLLLRVYAIGYFAGSFLPGTVGGDAVRCKLIVRTAGGYLKAAASILIERVTGVIAMIGLALLAIAHDPVRLATPPVLALVGGGSAMLILGLVVASNRRIATVLMYRTRRWRVRRVTSALFRLHRIFRRFPRRPILTALGWSLLFYLGSGGLLYCSCRAFARPISLVEATSVIAVVCVLMLVPLSLGGLGLRQAGDVYMLGLIGIDPASALIISLLRQTINYGYTAIGGILFLSWQGEHGVTRPVEERDSPQDVSGENGASGPHEAPVELETQGEDG